MFQINDTVMYGTHGVCKIEDITMKEFMGSQKEYYVLKPISDFTATLYVPTHNEKLLARMRRILSKQEVYQLIGMIKAIYLHKQKRESEGKRLYISDECFFREAERILYEEFQYVLDIKKEDLLPLIFSKIGEQG